MARTKHLWGRTQAAVRRWVLRFCLRDVPVLLAGSGSRHCDFGIVPCLPRPKVLQCAWKIETDANNGDFAWYPDMESMRYCFYVKPEVPPPRADRGAVSPG